jgi:hypothetical protein
MSNGAFFTFHYKYPKSRYELEGKTEDEIKRIKAEEFKKLTETVSGVDKANKMIFSEVEYNPESKMMEETKIERIDQSINDKAFMAMGEMGLTTQLSGHGVQPRMAGMQLGGNMGSSGKEVVTEANFMQDFLMVCYRQIIVDPINIVCDALDKSADFKVKRIESYTFDSTPTTSPDNPNPAQS